MAVVTVWKAEDGWRWHRVKSSDVVAESGEGYEDKRHAIRMAEEGAEDGDKIRVDEETGMYEYTYVAKEEE
jgi:hypothetical protein